MAIEAEVPYTCLTPEQRRAIIGAPFPVFVDVYRGHGWGGACTDKIFLKDGPFTWGDETTPNYFDTSDVDF